MAGARRSSGKPAPRAERRPGEVFVSVDIEASGPIPGRYSMLALGACVVGAPKTSFYAELRPISDAAVPEAMAVVGRTLDEFKKTGEPPSRAMRRFSTWVRRIAKGKRPVFVGFNATFDWSFVNWYFHSYAGTNPFGFGGLDIKSYYMGMSGCTWDDTRSSLLPPPFRSAKALSHQALQDATGQARMFHAIVAAARRAAKPRGRVGGHRGRDTHR